MAVQTIQAIRAVTIVLATSRAINRIIIYTGHTTHPDFGPYRENVDKHIRMFEYLNQHFRKTADEPPWKILTTPGEKLMAVLRQTTPHHTLLSLPAGQSTHLDNVFSQRDCADLMHWMDGGGRLYLTCGSAYWSSLRRRYSDLCAQSPTARKMIEKHSKIPLFKGIAQGPLCPFPGHPYKVGFYSDAVDVSNGQTHCKVLLSGGGSFIPDSDVPVQTLLRYLPKELERLGKQDHAEWERAAILVKRGLGGAVLTMCHPYYNSQDICTSSYEKAFPHTGTNWAQIHASLAPTATRMAFTYTSLIRPLEMLD